MTCVILLDSGDGCISTSVAAPSDGQYSLLKNECPAAIRALLGDGRGGGTTRRVLGSELATHLERIEIALRTHAEDIARSRKPQLVELIKRDGSTIGAGRGLSGITLNGKSIGIQCLPTGSVVLVSVSQNHEIEKTSITGLRKLQVDEGVIHFYDDQDSEMCVDAIGYLSQLTSQNPDVEFTVSWHEK